MKKQLTIWIIIVLSLFGCKKEYELEQALNNPSDQQIVEFVTINMVEEIRCDLLEMSFSVNLDKIPDTLTYSHLLFKNEANEARKIPASNQSVLIQSNCNLPTTYLITLYNDTLQVESRPTLYTYNP